jgi:hypothetical protein
LNLEPWAPPLEPQPALSASVCGVLSAGGSLVSLRDSLLCHWFFSSHYYITYWCGGFNLRFFPLQKLTWKVKSWVWEIPSSIKKPLHLAVFDMSPFHFHWKIRIFCHKGTKEKSC